MSFFCLICISSFIPERDLGKQTFEITWRVPNISLVNYDGEDHPPWPWLVYLKNPNTSYLRFMFICKSSVCFIDVVCMCSSLHIKYNIFNICFCASFLFMSYISGSIASFITKNSPLFLQGSFCALFMWFIVFTLCGARPSSTAPSPPTWLSPKPPKSLASGQTAGPTPFTV